MAPFKPLHPNIPTGFVMEQLQVSIPGFPSPFPALSVAFFLAISKRQGILEPRECLGWKGL